MTKIDLAKKLIEIADNLDDAHNVYDWGPGVYWSRDLREAAAALGAAEPPVLQMPPEFKEGTTHPRSTYFSEPRDDFSGCKPALGPNRSTLSVTERQIAPDVSHFVCPSCGVRLDFPENRSGDA